MKRVLVEWDDAYSEHGWYSEEDAKDLKPALSYTSGFLVHEDATKIVVAMTYSTKFEHQKWGVIKVIPKKFCRKVKVVKE